MPRATKKFGHIHIDWRVLAYAGMASLATGLFFGLVPALHAARRDSGAQLREGGRTGGHGAGGRRLRVALAVGELALALMLLVGAGLLVRSFIALNSQDAGFATSRVLALGLALPQARYPDDDRTVGFYEQLMERLAALPGVESVGAGSSLLLSRLPGSASINIEGRPPLPDGAQNIPVPYDTVTPGSSPRCRFRFAAAAC